MWSLRLYTRAAWKISDLCADCQVIQRCICMRNSRINREYVVFVTFNIGILPERVVEVMQMFVR